MEQYFSAPGRVELGGNHTDHQHGCVLAAAVDLEMRAAVTPNHDGVIRVFSQGFAPVEVALGDWTPRPEERNTTAALVRGMAAQFIRRGAALTGLDMRVTSQVPVGSGLSSSAAFEVLLGRVFSGLCCGGSVSPEDIARMGQTAERDYFGKPCGLMDQTACALGKLVFIDFNDPSSPVIEGIDFDFSKEGYSIIITDVHADHADLTAEYAAITEEMKSVAAYFGKDVLRDVNEKLFYESFPQLREHVSDRALMRAMHFFEENKRVLQAVEAVKNDNLPAFLEAVNASGESSWKLLQNTHATGSTAQAMTLGLALSRRILGEKGACRVHGGGFGGTILAFVPEALKETYTEKMERVFGKGACVELSVRPTGSTFVEL